MRSIREYPRFWRYTQALWLLAGSAIICVYHLHISEHQRKLISLCTVIEQAINQQGFCAVV